MTFVYSPNFDTNRKKIDTVFIHWIVGNLASADAVFQKTTPGTSAHYAVEDEKIHQYVLEENVAYHAGVYTWNQRSIGIEHSASPDRPASDKTYETSGKLIAQICKRWNIPIDREHIKGHKEVKATQCPGTMDIDRLISIAKTQNDPMATISQKDLDQMRMDRDNNYNMFRTLCEALGVAMNVDVAKAEIEKLIGLDDKLMEKDRQLNDSKKSIEALDIKIKELSESNKTLEDKNTENEKVLKEQKDTIFEQGLNISTLTQDIQQLKENSKLPTFTGVKLAIVKLLAKL